MTPAPAIGTMRLSTEASRDEERAIEVLHAALSAGVRLLDTADAYALDDDDAGHNERLIARAVASWEGDRAAVRIATKGGITRPGGRWVPDGRARHLRSACERSLEALGVARIDLYQLHVVDPRTPLEVSVRALARLQIEGLVAEVGLCNVGVAQIEQARRLVEIASVQVSLGPHDLSAIRGGVVAHCLRHGIRLLAHRPLGGVAGSARLASDPALAEVARRHGATPAEAALAWLLDLGAHVVPLPGPTHVATAESCGKVAALSLTDEDRELLDAAFPPAAAIRRGDLGAPAAAPPRADADIPEVVLVMGIPGSGKSTAARELAQQGYVRLNRDERGGRLAGIVRALDRTLEEGTRRVVLDNTYTTRASRREVLEVAARHGAKASLVWVDTPLHDAQVNACERMVARHGRLLSPEEMARAGKSDPESFPPRVQFQHVRSLEPPELAEGFAELERRPFVRAAPQGRRRALFVELDGILWKSRAGARTPGSVEDLEVVHARAAPLVHQAREGVLLVGTSWQPEIARGERTTADAERCAAALAAALGIEMTFVFCAHDAGPPACWCRKPLPGLGVAVARALDVDLGRSRCVGKGAADEGFAARLGMEYVDATSFFGAS